MANRRSINRVILVGNVGKDPEITHIPSLSKDVAKFSLATTEVFMDKGTNQFKDITEWHNIVAWEYQAKKVEKSLTKGSLVLVEGRIKTRKWKDKNDQDRYTTEIHADTITPLDKTPREASYGQGGNSGAGAGTPSGGQYQQGYGSGPSYMGDDSYRNSSGMQMPPEMQINDMNDIPYDDSDPF